MSMITIQEPMIITPRLLPGVKVEDGIISIEPTNDKDHYGKGVWKWYVDIPAGEFSGGDLAGWGDHKAMMGTFLAFLETAAESRPGGDCDDMFPAPMLEWARQLNADNISILRSEIEEE